MISVMPLIYQYTPSSLPPLFSCESLLRSRPDGWVHSIMQPIITQNHKRCIFFLLKKSGGNQKRVKIVIWLENCSSPLILCHNFIMLKINLKQVQENMENSSCVDVTGRTTDI